MLRLPLRMSLMRPDGTPNSSASRLPLIERDANSSARIAPGCTTISLSLVVVDDFDLESIAVAEDEADPPRTIDGKSPLPPARTLELVKPDALQSAKTVKADCRIKCSKPASGKLS